MCGVVGIVGTGAVNHQLFDALTILQHRGQDAAGIVTCQNQRISMRRGNGLVNDVFRQQHMQRLVGNMGIGHVRYPTAGTSSSAEAQPMYVNSPYGVTLAHNGNLTNFERLKADVFRDDLRHINTESDSEVLLNVLAHELQTQGAHHPSAEHIFNAIRGVHRRCRGAYAAVAMIIGIGVIGFRDPYGIRPLVYGRRETDLGDEYMIASETAALAIMGFETIRDVAPGEAVFINIEGQIETQICAESTLHTPCIFEQVYLARPDSIIDKVSVYKSRLRMGEKLANQILSHFSGRQHDIDVVIPIPDTGRTAALPLAHRLGVKYREGFIKNRYIGRTFIMPEQLQRQRSVRQKLNVIDLEIRGKNVLLVDDSIIRGTTITQIIAMARAAGAKKVYIASAAPAVRYPNVYGIDMPSPEEFIANNRSTEEVARRINADWLVYQRLEDLIASAVEGNPDISHYECSIFDGHYVTGDIDGKYLQRLSLLRNDAVKRTREMELHGDPTLIELHNQA